MGLGPRVKREKVNESRRIKCEKLGGQQYEKEYARTRESKIV